MHTRSASGRRVAFFTSGDDVLVVAEGDTFLGRFRLVHIGNDTADVEELGTGRHTTVPMVQPPGEPPRERNNGSVVAAPVAVSATWHTRARLESARERGYAYLMALFMVVALIIASQVAVQERGYEGRREREEEMIWRGQQYMRAIRLYYRKTGHYPTTLDDLKKGMPELHFLRYAAYKDPLKKDEGEWRFIYVNAAGQIIGSVKYATLQQMAIMDMNGGKIPGVKHGRPKRSAWCPGVDSR